MTKAGYILLALLAGFAGGVISVRVMGPRSGDTISGNEPAEAVQAKQFTQEAVENFECDFNKTELIRMMREDGFGELNWEDLKSQLNKINYECVDSAN